MQLADVSFCKVNGLLGCCGLVGVSVHKQVSALLGGHLESACLGGNFLIENGAARLIALSLCVWANRREGLRSGMGDAGQGGGNDQCVESSLKVHALKFGLLWPYTFRVRGL